MGSLPQTLVDTAPWVLGASTAQVRNAPSHEAGASEARCAGERSGAPSKLSTQRSLQTRPALARHQEQMGRGRHGRFSRMLFKEKFPRSPVISTSQGPRDLDLRNFDLRPPNSNCRKYL